MDAPEELRQAVRVVLADHFPMTPLYRVNRAADAVLAVPAIADALRAAERDAKVAEIVAELSEPNPSTGHIIRCANACGDIAALYPATP